MSFGGLLNNVRKIERKKRKKFKYLVIKVERGGKIWLKGRILTTSPNSMLKMHKCN